MWKSMLLWGAVSVLVVGLLGFGGWIFSLPPATATADAPPVPRGEMDAMLSALRHEGGNRPLVAIVGLNEATETTDYLMPAGILRRADIADVLMLATGPGPVRLYPAGRGDRGRPCADSAAAHQEAAFSAPGPAMTRDVAPAVLAWLRDQSRKGARIIGICAGAKVLGAAGLIDGRRATTHWYYRDEMLERSPGIDYVADRRMVADGNVVTTTGISASMPMMLALIEAVAGRAKAQAIADDLGVETWDMRHASAAFSLTRPFVTTVLANRLAFWNRDARGIELRPGMDEVSLALVADAWSRTYRSSALTFAETAGTVETRNGIRVIPDRVAMDWPPEDRASLYPGQRPADALDDNLQAIADTYGARTMHVVAMQLEYPRRD